MRKRVTEFTIIFVAVAVLFAVAALAYSLGWHRGYDAALGARALVVKATAGLQSATYRAEPSPAPVTVVYNLGVAHPKATAAVPPPAVSPKPGAVPQAAPGPWRTAKASWYGPGLYSTPSETNYTADGTEFTPSTWCVAHKTLPLGTWVEIAYRGRIVRAQVKDTGPHVPGREFDLSNAVARALGFSGVQTIRWRVL